LGIARENTPQWEELGKKVGKKANQGKNLGKTSPRSVGWLGDVTEDSREDLTFKARTFHKLNLGNGEVKGKAGGKVITLGKKAMMLWGEDAPGGAGQIICIFIDPQ